MDKTVLVKIKRMQKAVDILQERINLKKQLKREYEKVINDIPKLEDTFPYFSGSEMKNEYLLKINHVEQEVMFLQSEIDGKMEFIKTYKKHSEMQVNSPK